ncbi:hypothetical protein [Nonlabens dokdonensis]|nr:hypothetical protein [Nonlabens dokdonensis]
MTQCQHDVFRSIDKKIQEYEIDSQILPIYVFVFISLSRKRNSK